tara:strand:- start:457 stop:1050 length:594 start_codon:yes stop_codon:yes gene_type:complete
MLKIIFFSMFLLLTDTIEPSEIKLSHVSNSGIEITHAGLKISKDYDDLEMLLETNYRSSNKGSRTKVFINLDKRIGKYQGFVFTKYTSDTYLDIKNRNTVGVGFGYRDKNEIINYKTSYAVLFEDEKIKSSLRLKIWKKYHLLSLNFKLAVVDTEQSIIKQSLEFDLIPTTIGLESKWIREGEKTNQINQIYLKVVF